MRPGHFAPDIRHDPAKPYDARTRFNEAGAFCPGYLWNAPPQYALSQHASMRPGHFAPDIRLRRGTRTFPSWGFNEAGAFCPGYAVRAPCQTWQPGCFNEAGAFCPGYLGEHKARVVSAMRLQ